MSHKFIIEEHEGGFVVMDAPNEPPGPTEWLFIPKRWGLTKADVEALITSRMSREPKPRYKIDKKETTFPYVVRDNQSYWSVSYGCWTFHEAERLLRLLSETNDH